MAESLALSPRQARFVEEYILDLNATQAAIRAGYRARSAEVTGSRLLRDAKVSPAVQAALEARQALVAAQQAEVLGGSGITQARVLAELALLAFSDLTHYVVDDSGDVKLSESAPAGAMRALQSIKRKFITRSLGDEALEKSCEVEIKLWDKPGPLKLAGRHVGLFPDRVELTGKDGAALPQIMPTADIKAEIAVLLAKL